MDIKISSIERFITNILSFNKTGNHIKLNLNLGTGNAEGTNWAVAKPTKWLAPKAVLDFQREHNLNMERFKAYVNRRVRDMRNRGRPQKLIELLSAPEGSPFEMFSQDTYRKEISLFVPYGFDMEELTTDLLAHLTMQLKILKQIMSN